MPFDSFYIDNIPEKVDATKPKIHSSYCAKPLSKNVVVRRGLFLLTFVKPAIYNTLKNKLEASIKNFQIISNPSMLESPSDLAIDLALKTLGLYTELDITPEVNPSLDGGVIFEFFKNESYYLLEIFNDGDIVFLERRGSTRNVNEYSFEDFKKRIELIINEELQVC